MFPCPKCLVPNAKLTDFNMVYAVWTPELTVQKLEEARIAGLNSKAEAEEILKAFSLRPIIIC